MTGENGPSSAPQSSRLLAVARRIRSSVTRERLSLLGTVAVLIVGGVIAVRTVDTAQLATSVRHANPLLLAGAIAVYTLSWPIRGRRYDDILGAMEYRCGAGFTTGAIFVSQTANLVVPARAGDGLRVYLLKTRRELPYSKGVASLTVERLFDLLVLLGLGGLALAWLGMTGDIRSLSGAAEFVVPAGIVGGAGAVLLILLIGTARYDPGMTDRFPAWISSSRLRWIADLLWQVGADLREMSTTPRAFGLVSAGSLVVWGLDVLTAVLVLAAVSGMAGLGGVEFLAIGTLAVTVGNLAKVLPLSQGGIGLYEAAFTALVVAVSPIGSAAALAAAVLDHALKNVLTVLGGMAAVVVLNVSPSTVPAEHETESSDF